jgi:DMSO/TMAO reductase YedYZ molybdopterin-dependent catalytic subunit
MARDLSDLNRGGRKLGAVDLALIMGGAAVRGVASALFPKKRPGPDAAETDMESTPEIVSPDTRRDRRVPPGQVETRRWPVLHAGSVPKVDLADWDLKLFGLVEEPRAFSWEEFRALPRSTVLADMHCVTHWSRLDNRWEGVLVRDVMAHVALKPEARYVVAHSEHGFTTNLPLADFLGDDCLFAWGHDGRDLDPDHGWPLRLVVPRLYAWKSAKWLRGIEFVRDDRPGFWEENGYHNHGDPWTEERYW